MAAERLVSAAETKRSVVPHAVVRAYNCVDGAGGNDGGSGGMEGDGGGYCLVTTTFPFSSTEMSEELS